MITTSCEYIVEKTKDNYDILKVNIKDKWVYIGSKYNMKAEIDKFLDDFKDIDDKKIIFLIFGFGTGEHIKALRNKHKYNKIIVFEPNKNLGNYILSLNWIEEDKNLEILCCETESMILKVSNYVEEYNLDDIKFGYFSKYDIYKIEIQEFLKSIKELFINLRINRNTKMFFCKRWFETLIKNIPYFVEGVPVDLYKDYYKNKPAIIVSAGPSLEKNIDQLKNLNNEFLIISGGRTLKSLLNKGIKPDLLTVADAGQISYDLVKGYIEEADVPLLFYEGTNEDVVSKHKGNKIFFSTSAFIDKICETPISQFASGGSVAHSMTSCAILMGCNPIIFIGQDLAYTNDKKYSSISLNSDGSGDFEDRCEKNDIFVEGIDGKPIRTSLELNYFRTSFEKIIKENPEIEFINATEGGARIHGTNEMKLSEVIKKYKNNKLEAIQKLEYDINLKENAIKSLKEAKKSAKLICNKSEKILEILKKIKKDYTNNHTNEVNLSLKKLDKIDEQITEEYKNVELVKSLLYPIVYETLNQRSIKDMKVSNNDVDFIIKENERLYKAFIDELNYAIKYIDEALYKLIDIN